MFTDLMPDPLHPAVVHFPVVLILLGSATAWLAVFWRRNHLPLLAAVLLALGAVGAWAAVETGESDGGLLEGGSPEMESLVEAHENWAKRTLAASVAAAAGAIGSLFLARFARTARGVAMAAAVAAAGSSYAVYETGHRGGALVFRHGAAVQVQPGSAGSAVEKAAEVQPGAGEHSNSDRD